MSPFKYGAAALLAVCLGGCASTPQPAAPTVAPNAPAIAEAADAEPTVLEIDARDLDPGLVMTCRDMLKPGSNVIVRYCLTRDDWKTYERQQALWAQDLVRRIQGGTFR